MSDAVTLKSNRFDTWLIIVIGLLQGAAIAALIDASIAPALTAQPWLKFSLWGWVLFLPPTAQWLIAHRRRPAYWLLLAAVAALVPLVCWEPTHGFLPNARQQGEAVLIVGGTVAWAALISLASAGFQRGGWHDYPSLFRLTCRTLLLPAGAALFMLIFSLLLELWAALFSLIGIDLFERLFRDEQVVTPLRGAVFGIATAILIDRPALVDGVRRAGTAIAAALLPFIVIIHLVFLGGLLVVGLEPLWGTRHATPTVLTLLIIFVIMLNGAHEEGSKLDCLRPPIAGAVRLAILLSPIYVAIAVYAIWLRVAQYGWSPDRVIGACVTAFVGLLILTYVVQTVRRPLFSLPRLAVANAGALAALVILGIAVNSPLLSPKRITATSQEDRILSGRNIAGRYELDQLAFALGPYGRDALARLAEAAQDDDLRKKAAATLLARPEDSYGYFAPGSREVVAENFTVVPGNLPLPPDLLREFRTSLKEVLPYPYQCSDGCKLLAVDLNQDGAAEIVLLAGNFPVFHRQNGRWMQLGQLLSATGTPRLRPEERNALIRQLSEGEGKAVVSDWRDLEVNGRRFRIK